MPADLVQQLLTGDTGAIGATTTMTMTGSKTVTAGNDIFVLVATDVSGSLSGVSDNLGNTYTLIKDLGGSLALSTRLYLCQAHAITGGVLTTITVVLTTNVTLIVGGSCEMEGITGTGLVADDDNSDNNDTTPHGTTPTGDGLHWFAVADHKSSGGGVTPPVYTLPAGYTTAIDYAAGSGSPSITSYYGARLGFLVGNDSGVISGSYSTPVNWVTSSSMMAAILPPPEGAGVSFDGVTIRA